MNRQLTYRLFLLGLLICGAAHAQDDRQPRMTLDAMDYLRWKSQMDKSGEPIIGSPFQNPEFIPGYIRYADQSTRDQLVLRYNILHDEVEFLQKDRVMVLVNNPPVDRVVIGVDTLVFYSNDRAGAGGYFQLMRSGEIQLLAKLKVEFKEKQPAKAMRDPVPAQYVRKNDRFFIRLKTGERRVFTNTKKLIEQLGDSEAELSAFAKKEKLAAKAPEDWIRLIGYYESIQEE